MPSSHAAATAALTDHLVPSTVDSSDVVGVGWLRATVARFAEGADHTRRRTLATDLLAQVPPADLRASAHQRATAVLTAAAGHPIDVMTALARPVPIATLAAALGIPTSEPAGPGAPSGPAAVPSSPGALGTPSGAPTSPGAVTSGVPSSVGSPGVPSASGALSASSGVASSPSSLGVSGSPSASGAPSASSGVPSAPSAPGELPSSGEPILDVDVDADVAGLVAVVARAYHPSAGPDPEADRAVRALVAACGGVPDELAAARIGLLVQACDATAALVGLAVLAADAAGWDSPEDLITEVLRHGSPVRVTRRVAADGTPVVVDLAAANRDPAVFADPDQFRPGRADGHRHLGFGAGRHRCPGDAHALALVAGVLDALRGCRVLTPNPDLEPSPNLRIPTTLLVVTP
jgi:cytochrome P450